MKLFLHLLILFAAARLFAADPPQGTSMRATNGIGFGATTIGGRLIATNTTSRGGTNRIEGSLLLGSSYYFPVTDEKLLINTSITNPAQSYASTMYLSSKFASTTNHDKLQAGITSLAMVGEGNTGDWTSGSGSYYGLAGINTTVQSMHGSTGTVRRVIGVGSTIAGPGGGPGAIIDEADLLWIDTANAANGATNSFNYLVGLKASGLSAGGNNTGIWLGFDQHAYPSIGNWSIWDETTFPARFSGNISSEGIFYGNGSGITNAPYIADLNGNGTNTSLTAGTNYGSIGRTNYTWMDVNGWHNTNTSAALQSVSVQKGNIAADGKVAIGSTGSTNWLSVVSGTLTTNAKSLDITGTLASSASTETGARIAINGAGSGANVNVALAVTLPAGYTGSSAAEAITAGNTSLGTGTAAWTAGAGNFGLDSGATGAASGNNVGIVGRAQQSGSLNLAVFGRAVFANNSAPFNVAVAGHALNASTANVGVFAGLMNTAPATLTSAALMADNGAVNAPIFTARDNGTTTFNIENGGDFDLITGTYYGNGAGLTNLTYILYTNGVGTNTTFYGPLSVADYIYATNSARTNTISGSIQQGGSLAVGTQSTALGLNTVAGASYDLISGIRNSTSATGTLTAGASNTVFSTSAYSLVAGAFNQLSGLVGFIVGDHNQMTADRNTAIGKLITSDANTFGSIGMGRDIYISSQASNSFVFNTGMSALTTTRSNAFMVQAESGSYFTGGPIFGDGSGLSLPPANLTAYSDTNTLTITATGLTNATLDTYMLSITSGVGMALADTNGTVFLTPLVNSTVPFKPGWRFTAASAAAGVCVIMSK